MWTASVLTKQTVQWIKDVQCCANSVRPKLDKQGQSKLVFPRPKRWLSLSLSLSLFLSLSLSLPLSLSLSLFLSLSLSLSLILATARPVPGTRCTAEGKVALSTLFPKINIIRWLKLGTRVWELR